MEIYSPPPSAVIVVGTTGITGGTVFGLLWEDAAGKLAAGPALTNASGIITLPTGGTLAVNGATIGANALAVTGTANITGTVSIGGNVNLSNNQAFQWGASDFIQGNASTHLISAFTNGNQVFALTGGGSTVLGSAAIATNAVDGFLYAVSGAGTPTGAPTTQTGRVPIYIDTTNSQLWLYMGGAWKQPKTPAGAATVTWQ